MDKNIIYILEIENKPYLCNQSCPSKLPSNEHNSTFLMTKANSDKTYTGLTSCSTDAGRLTQNASFLSVLYAKSTSELLHGYTKPFLCNMPLLCSKMQAQQRMDSQKTSFCRPLLLHPCARFLAPQNQES